MAVHAFIGLTRSGEVAAYQILPWEYRAWHCGGSGNDTHLSIEICEDNLQDREYFDRVYQMAMELTAELCRKFRLDPLAPGVVVDHAEGAASFHSDSSGSRQRRPSGSLRSAESGGETVFFTRW